MITIYASPTGSVGCNGNKENPYDILSAKKRVSCLIEEKVNEDIQVILRGGTYTLKDTLVFSQSDTFDNSANTVSWKAYEGEKPIFSAAIPVTGWKKVDYIIEGLPEAAQGEIWEVDLPENNGKKVIPKTLYQGFRRIPRARSKGFAPLQSTHPSITESIDLIRSDELFDTMYFPQGAVRQYENIEDAELVIRPSYVWTMNILPIENIDEKNSVLKTAIQATYPLYKLRSAEHHRARECSAWIENVADGMTERDRFMVDSKKNKIYYWPREKGQELNTIIVPLLTELVRIEGTEENPVKNLILENITFCHGDRYTWNEETIGLQHDWDIHDSPNALVRLKAAEHCGIRKCRFTASGGGAVRLDLYCMNNFVEDNWIRNIGGTGILLSGYGAGNKDLNRNNVVAGNDIGHCGEILWASPGIYVSQSGHNRIEHNLIHDLPYNAIVISGPRTEYLLYPHHRREWFKSVRWDDVGTIARDVYESIIKSENNETVQYNMHVKIEKFLHARNNLIEANEIHHVVQLLADGDAVYLSGTGDNNVIKGNYIHDVISPGTGCHILRPDGSEFWTKIEENVLYRCSGTILTRSLCDTNNNFIINIVLPQDAEAPIRRHQPISYFLGVKDINISRSNTRNIYYQSDYIDNFARFDDNNIDIDVLPDVISDNNLYFSPLDYNDLKRQFEIFKEKTGLDKNSIVADPMFIDVENGDFRLHGHSPARTLGIKDIDLSNVGIRGRNNILHYNKNERRD